MPRPKGYDPAVLSERMMDVFWQKGYEATSLSDLAQATGVRSGSLHAGFGQKPDLFAAALTAYDAIFFSAMSVEGRGRDRLHRYIDLLYNRVTDDPTHRGCFVVASASEIDRHTDENRAAIRQRIEQIQAFIQEALAGEGIHAPDAAAAFLGAIISLLALSRCEAGESVLRGIRNEAKRHLNLL